MPNLVTRQVKFWGVFDYYFFFAAFLAGFFAAFLAVAIFNLLF